MNKVHVKKTDTVLVISGKDKGKKGKILHVDPTKQMVLVEGVNMQTKHKKPKSARVAGGRITQEGHVHASNVMLICNKCDQVTKVGKKLMSTGEKARECKKCGEIIDMIKEIQ